VRRSWLFVPGNRPDRFDKACATRAHGVIVDLEDAVPPGDKSSARDALRRWLRPGQPVFVRVNAVGTEWFDDDVAVCAEPGVAGIVLPKTEHADHVTRVAGARAGLPILPLVVTARGLWNALAIAQAPGVLALLFGSLDFQVDTGVADDELLYARSHLVIASRVAGIPAPVDGVTQAFDDPELLRRDCCRSRQLGFGGKACIHPNQVDIVNAAFAPGAEDVDWAQRVVAAFERSGGRAAQLDGRMIDRPVLLKAQAILAERTGAAKSV
jgi:citrate lyase subunit beta / citryl-CoA lyase